MLQARTTGWGGDTCGKQMLRRLGHLILKVLRCIEPKCWSLFLQGFLINRGTLWKKNIDTKIQGQFQSDGLFVGEKLKVELHFWIGLVISWFAYGIQIKSKHVPVSLSLGCFFVRTCDMWHWLRVFRGQTFEALYSLTLCTLRWIQSF